MKICVSICTRNRGEQLWKCLNVLSQQQADFNRLILVEDISELTKVSRRRVNQSFKDIRIDIFSVRFKNLSKSRQVVINFLEKEKYNDILVFIDDDVLIHPSLLKKVKQLHQKYPSVSAFVGPVLAQTKSPLTQAQVVYYNDNYLFDQKMQEIRAFPSSLVSIQFRQLRKLKVGFDQKFVYGQDIDFCLSLSEAGGKIYFHPKLFCTHRFSTSFFVFLRKRYMYSKYTGLLHIKHPKMLSVDQYLPSKKKHVFLLPFVVCWLSIANAKYLLKISHTLSYKVGFYLFCNEFVSILGLYSSKEGMNLLIERISLLFSE